MVVVSGPSGCGKGSILKELAKKENIAISISATTRKIRDGEVDGKDYFYLTKAEFMEKIENDEILEYNEYCGFLYGTLKEQVRKLLNEKEVVILEIDVNGAAAVKNEFDVVKIFIVPPSLEVLKERLKFRGTETKDSFNARLNKAKDELKLAEKYDYVVINDSINLAADKINHVIEAEKLKFKRQAEKINWN